jgi:trehalose synthase
VLAGTIVDCAELASTQRSAAQAQCQGDFMNVCSDTVVQATLGAHSIQSYEPLIGAATVERVLNKSKSLAGRRISHISSTFYGGGVAEILTPLTLLTNAVGIDTDWRLIQGTPAFFLCTKMLHNALQGGRFSFTREQRSIYEAVAEQNSVRLHLEDSNVIIVHDPQPLPLISQFVARRMPWIWQCHIDLSNPDAKAWSYIKPFVDQYDLAVFSLPEYGQELATSQRFVTPAIDPFSAKNCELSPDDALEILQQHGIPTDLPIVAQISRFDRWKDPAGVIEAFRLAQRAIDCNLVLLGSPAVDDPESGLVLESLESSLDDRVHILTVDDPLLVNALQRSAAVVLQKSLREGFGLTVTEAMWKGAAVIGGNVGGIRHQIVDGESGFLVNSVQEAADRIVQLLGDERLRQRLGAQARERVRERYLLSHLLEEWLDTIAQVSP